MTPRHPGQNSRSRFARLPVWLLVACVLALWPSGRELLPATAQAPGLPNPVTSNDEWTPVLQGSGNAAMALTPRGCFMMGSNGGDHDARPVHEQCLEQAFWIDAHEVTNEQFAAFLNAAGNQTEGGGAWYDTGSMYAKIQQEGDAWIVEDGFADHPVVEVSWFGAAAYCAWRSARLPTEAEWEYAARGPDALVYSWGNKLDSSRPNFCDANCTKSWRHAGVDDGYQFTAPVAAFPGDRSWVGAYDMVGNVREWTSSIYRPYPYDVTDGREIDGKRDSQSPRAIRGGSWAYDIIDLPLGRRFAVHHAVSPSQAKGDGGIRCVRDADPSALAPTGELVHLGINKHTVRRPVPYLCRSI